MKSYILFAFVCVFFSCKENKAKQFSEDKVLVKDHIVGSRDSTETEMIDSLHTLVIDYAMSERYDKALKVVDELLFFDPKNYKAWNSKANIKYLLGDIAEAENSYKYCYELSDSTYGEALSNLIFMYTLTKQYEKVDQLSPVIFQHHSDDEIVMLTTYESIFLTSLNRGECIKAEENLNALSVVLANMKEDYPPFKGYIKDYKKKCTE